MIIYHGTQSVLFHEQQNKNRASGTVPGPNELVKLANGPSCLAHAGAAAAEDRVPHDGLVEGGGVEEFFPGVFLLSK